ncbi:ATP-binding cassette sub-family C member 4-like isoform X2 [Apostichopus japonicus]
MGPLEAICVLVLLYFQIGWACLPGYIVMFGIIAGQTWMSKVFVKLRARVVQYTDKRVTLMSEIITSMRTIKMNACEQVFTELVRKVRNSEYYRMLMSAYATGINLVLGRVGYRLLDVGMILAYTLTTDDPIKASTIFVIVSFCQILSGSFMRFFPRAVQLAAEGHVTVKRIEEVLKFASLKDDILEDANNEVSADAVVVRNVNYSVDQDTSILKNISFNIPKGSLTAVIGPVGSGKTSLLLAILKEITLKQGSVQTSGWLAYVRQQPWVFGGTVRQNILFGEDYDAEKFDRITNVCCLDKDLAGFPDSDLTMIGERGITLSGGQKARVSLARALYSEADVFLLDDPLSAVDVAVSKDIFNRCIMGYLSNKTCILVTHQLQYLTQSDHVIVLNKGQVEAMGTLSELEEEKVDFTKFVKAETEKEGKQDKEQEKEKEEKLKANKKPGVKTELAMSEETRYKLFFKEETKRVGAVGLKLYFNYFKAGTNWLGFLLLIFFLLSAQAVHFIADLWLAWWADKEELETAYNVTGQPSNITYITSNLDTNESAAIYAGIVAILLLLNFVRAFYCFSVMLNSSKKLHQKMFAALIRAPILFFDTTPTGRIQNRFTKDVGIMDDNLPLTFYVVIQLMLLVFTTVLANAIFNPYSLILVVPIGFVFMLLWRYALITTRPIKRLDGTTRSPIFSHITTTMEGVQTVRLHRRQTEFIQRFKDLQDRHTEVWFLYLVTQRWFLTRVNILLFLFGASITYAAVITKNRLDAGLVGLLLSSTINMVSIFKLCISQMALTEYLMTSTERVMEYAKLKPEDDPGSTTKPPPKGWPYKGSLSMRDVSLTYTPSSPPVLKNISFKIEPREKIGIVGRTGAGKSSLIASIFRLVEPQGVITIDGIPTSTISLPHLRTNLSIIPQDPVLFTGSLRMNLDPLQRCPDDRLWQALSDVQLSNTVKHNPQKLEMNVGVGGSNFSLGQRQLICLARALLRENLILILDEATASVDPQMDALIQHTLHSKFDHCVVITVAHRLNTIMDSNKVMVLDGGQVVEFDHPYNLLQNSAGAFSNFVSQLGPTEAKRLRQVAYECYQRIQDVQTTIKDDKQREQNHLENDLVVKDDELEETMLLLESSESGPQP